MTNGKAIKKPENFHLILTLGGLCTLAVVLITAIVIININSGSSNEPGNTPGETEIVRVREYLSGIEGINDDTTMEEAIAIYQKYIDGAANDEERVIYYNKRIDYITGETEFGEYSEQIVNDTIAIDKIMSDSDSAAQVANIADSYGMEEIAEEYQQIYEKRYSEEDNEPIGEGRG